MQLIERLLIEVKVQVCSRSMDSSMSIKTSRRMRSSISINTSSSGSSSSTEIRSSSSRSIRRGRSSLPAGGVNFMGAGVSN